MSVQGIESIPAKVGDQVRLIVLGDVVGRPGRAALRNVLPEVRQRLVADCVVVNGENAAGGAGIDQKTAAEIKAAGADVITLGDHAFQRKGSSELLDSNGAWCIRPSNLPKDTTPGSGSLTLTLANGAKIAVINLLGRTFISSQASCPFRELDRWLDGLKGEQGIITICDLHAEATSEKWAMARHTDGRLSLLVGTHTHVQTSDAQILPGGTAYITDLGMTGCHGGVIGMDNKVALHRFLSPRPAPYEIAEGIGTLSGIVVDLDRHSGKAKAIYTLRPS